MKYIANFPSKELEKISKIFYTQIKIMWLNLFIDLGNVVGEKQKAHDLLPICRKDIKKILIFPT